MKKIVIFLFFVFPVSSGFCQKWITFDDSINLFRIQIDTTLPNNIWQIGQPQKTTFTSSRSIPNGIVTDLHNPYPVNNTSVFYLGTGGDNFDKEHFAALWFWYKIDCDTLNDFGKVEVTSDMGNTWWNQVHLGWDIFDSLGNYITGSGSGDTIVFTGKTKKWYQFYGQLPLSTTFIDSIIYRFTFHSDNIPDNRDGWIIDDINFGDVLSQVINKNPIYSIYPNPTRDFIIFKSDFHVTSFEIMNELGNKLYYIEKPENHFSINLTNFNPGIYYIRVRFDDGHVANEKIVKIK